MEHKDAKVLMKSRAGVLGAWGRGSPSTPPPPTQHSWPWTPQEAGRSSALGPLPSLGSRPSPASVTSPLVCLIFRGSQPL